jgi:GTP cyclohydrolase IA
MKQQEWDASVLAIKSILKYIGDDPRRDGLFETPTRVVKSWEEIYAGYKQYPEDVITTFEDDCDEVVIVKDIEFSSMCEHHMLPFIGKAHIGYIPDGKVLGLSKMPRILDIYAKRLQIQERICQQVTKALDKYVKPIGSACVIEAVHMCMSCRGVKKQHSKAITSSLTGAFKTDPAARQEFMGMIK